jgi:hypothetical protein
MQGAGFEEVRVVASSMLEGWLNNPVHLRAAKSLLDRILQHTHGTSDNDFNTVANLLALHNSSTQAPEQVHTRTFDYFLHSAHKKCKSVSGFCSGIEDTAFCSFHLLPALFHIICCSESYWYWLFLLF